VLALRRVMDGGDRDSGEADRPEPAEDRAAPRDATGGPDDEEDDAVPEPAFSMKVGKIYKGAKTPKGPPDGSRFETIFVTPGGFEARRTIAISREYTKQLGLNHEEAMRTLHARAEALRDERGAELSEEFHLKHNMSKTFSRDVVVPLLFGPLGWPPLPDPADPATRVARSVKGKRGKGKGRGGGKASGAADGVAAKEAPPRLPFGVPRQRPALFALPPRVGARAAATEGTSDRIGGEKAQEAASGGDMDARQGPEGGRVLEVLEDEVDATAEPGGVAGARSVRPHAALTERNPNRVDSAAQARSGKAERVAEGAQQNVPPVGDGPDRGLWPEGAGPAKRPRVD